MSNILIVCPDRNDATAFYRASGISHDLANKSGHNIKVMGGGEAPITWQVLSEYEIIMMQRPFTPNGAELCKYAKGMNKKLWIDYDDNLFALNPENRAFLTYSNADTQQNIKVCLAAADVVTVPTEFLRQSYLPFNKDIRVIPNAFNDDIFSRGELKPRAKKVLWRGPDTHIYDMMTYGKEINQISEEFADWEFLFMGFYPWFTSETKNKGHIQGLDVISYYNRIRDEAPSAFHVLLHDDTFNRCRSNIAWIEGSWAGAVCVVPGWWNVPGALPYSTPDEYYEAMRSLLSGEVDIEVMNRMAWEFIMDTLRLSKVNIQRLELINSLL